MSNMKLYLLQQHPSNGGSPLDQTHAVVVRAASVFEARTLASSKAGGEGVKTWLDSKLTSCEELTSEGEAGVLHVGVR